MKENSPFCGERTVFHPALADTLIPGQGMAVGYLLNDEVAVFAEYDLDEVEELIEEA